MLGSPFLMKTLLVSFREFNRKHIRRKPGTLLFVAAMAWAIAGGGLLRAAESKTLNVLFVGNSFTGRHRLAEVVKAMAEAGNPGLTFNVTTVIYGGSTLQDHWQLGTQSYVGIGSLTREEEMRMIRSIEDLAKNDPKNRRPEIALALHQKLLGFLDGPRPRWDIVVLQSYRDDLEGENLSYFEYAPRFAELARSQGAQVVLYETAPTMQNAEPLKAPPAYEPVVAKETAMAALAKRIGATVVPMPSVAFACQTARPDLTLKYVHDAVHPNQTMAYLTACAFYAVLFERSPVGLPVDRVTDTRSIDKAHPEQDRDGGPITRIFTKEERAQLQQIAEDGVKRYRRIARESTADASRTTLPEYRKFLEKAKAGETIRVAYLGGSITVGGSTDPQAGVNREGKPYAYSMQVHRDSWRALTFEWLRKTYEQRPGQFEQVDAGLGGTNSMFGAFRLAKDVLPYKPDLLFIEFAVNDNRMGRATEQDPTVDQSIYRTYQSIIGRVRRANPDVAIFITISASRPQDVNRAFEEKTPFDASARVTEQVANYFKVPFVRVRDVYYRDPLPAGLERDRLYDGPESAGNTVHPSPQGHRAYAEGVIRELRQVFSHCDYAFAEVAMPPPRPYPLFAAMYLGPEIRRFARGSWELKPMKNRWTVEPSKIGDLSLVTSDPNAVIEFPFTGKAVGGWFDVEVHGRVDIYVDGERVGTHAPKSYSATAGEKLFVGRAHLFATGLDPLVPHRLRLVASPNQKEFTISIHGLFVEETTDYGRDDVPQKQVDTSVFQTPADPIMNDGFQLSDR